MPSFGRLSKHSNRSQHALPEQLSTGAGGSGSSAASGSGPSGGAVQAQAQAHAQTQQGGGAIGALGALGSAGQADSPAEGTQVTPQSALSSTTALSSSDHLETFVDARPPPQSQQQLQQQQQQQLQQQQQQHQQHPPPPPPHLFNPQSAGVNLPPSLQTPGAGGSPAFDGHQPPTPIDFTDPSVSRSQSQRYGAPLTPQQLQQHQQVYGTASGSIDDLPSTSGYHQPPPPPQQQSAPAPAPQKRSTRKLIKGIFGSSRESHDAHHQQQQQPPPPTQSTGHNPPGPYDNTAGLARRPSKRVSNPPNLKTSSSQTAQAQLSPDRDWQTQGTGSGPYSQQPSPLHEVGEVDEYSFYAHGSNTDSPLQDSRILLSNNGIRQVSSEHLETSPYDDVYQPPDHPPPHQQQQQQPQLHSQQPPPPLQQPQPQPLQRQGTLRLQEQQAQYESQQQLQQQQSNFHYPTNSAQSPYQPGGEPRLITSQLVTSQQLQNAETISQLSHDSPVTDSDPRSAFQQHSGQPSQGGHHAPTPSQDISTNPPPVQGLNPQGQDQSAMAPPAPGGVPQSSRRGQEAEKALRGQVDPNGPPPGYHRQGSVSLNAMSPIPPPPGQGAPPISGYRGDRSSQYIDASPGVDQGRNSPQPSDRDPELEKQFKDLR